MVPFFHACKPQQNTVFSGAIYGALDPCCLNCEGDDGFVIDKSYFINFILLPSVGMLILTYISETLLKQMQIKQALVKIEKMEVLSQLAASISHEVKNPLTVIKGFLRLLNQDNLPPGKKEQYLKIASSELNRAEEIIDDYLTFAKPDPEQVESISIAEQLHKLADMVEPLSNQQSVLVQKQIDDATILGNTRSFQQAFLNIIKTPLNPCLKEENSPSALR